MTAAELFKAGQLNAAVDAQIADVKGHPADPARRLFLFEMVLFTGDLDRAARQAGMIKYNDMEIDANVSGYGKLLDAERARRKVLREGGQPSTYGPHADQFVTRLKALDLLRNKDPQAAAAALAGEEVTPLSGTINGQPFAALADGDDVLAPFLEVINPGGYYWVPLSAIKKVTTKAPSYPRDLFWLPATLEIEDAEGQVFLPTIYAFSHESTDDAIKLGRATDWTEESPVRGLGAKTFMTDEDPISLLDIRELIINPTN